MNRSYRHIILAGITVWSLAACGGRDNINRADWSVGGSEPAKINIPSQTVDDIDIMSLLENYIYTGDDTTANILNVVNMFQFSELIHHQDVMDDLAVDNYALLPDTLPQMFQVYQRNDSLQIPNFVTVDLMAQLSHVYESYLLRTVEEKHFAPMLTNLCLALYNASVEQANRAATENIKNMAAYNAAFLAVSYHLLTGKTLKTQGDFPATVEIELAYIAQQENRRPALLDIKSDFEYSVFKPYGHYTRTAGLRRYFKAWKWLQLAPYCSDNKTQLQQAVLLALALQTAKTQSGISAMDVYSRLTGAMEWFSGPPASTLLLDIAQLLKKEGITTVTAALDTKLLTRVTALIGNSTAARASVVNHPAVCRNGIYFMPQPVFAEEGTETSSYNKRYECVQAMQQKTGYHPVFAQKEAWNRKKLETSSVLQEKLKHNVLLYGVVPDHPEPLPATSLTDTLSPLTVGYVEPALPFWTKLREWVELTDKILTAYQLTNDTITAFSAQIHRYVALMENAVRKQQNNERLPDETCRFIAHIGDSIQLFTLSMIEPKIDRWDWVAGTDRSVAFNQIYVIVEIDGKLYLTKGATFSYTKSN